MIRRSRPTLAPGPGSSIELPVRHGAQGLASGARPAAHARLAFMVRPLLSMLVAVAALAWSPRASAYAWMIRHEYTSCATCHVDPSGGGLLTPYGRAQGEVLLRSHYTPQAEDAEPGKIADFAFGLIPLPEPLLLGGDYRLAYLNSTLKPQNGESATDSRFIQMQADLEGQLTFDRFRIAGSLGYDHQGAADANITSRTTDNLISRTFWLGFDLGADRQWLLRVGRINQPYGIRSIEHTLFIHTPSFGLGPYSVGNDINQAQQTGVALAYTGDKIRGEVMAMLGNYQVNPDDFRQRGYAGYVEWSPVEKTAIGASSKITYSAADELLGTHPSTFRHAHGVFGRYSPVKPLVLTAEADFLAIATKPSNFSTGVTGMLQADVEVWQGLHLGATGELLKPPAVPLSATVPASSDTLFGAWGTLWWFFLPHVELRSDFIFEQASATQNTFTYLVQLHFYL